MADDRDESPLGRGYGAGWAIVGAGFQLAFSILFFMGLGYLADRWLGTRPLLMLLGLALGLAAGFYAFWLRVKAAAEPPRR
jgi:F0F1-type ATP synthase assembly protein I